MPKTTLGSWSVKLALASLTFFLLLLVISFFGNKNNTFADKNLANIYLSAYPLLLIISGVLGCVSGIVALVSSAKFQERSWLLVFPLLLSLIIVYLAIVEFIL